jgi:DNA mismatch repair protein MutS
VLGTAGPRDFLGLARSCGVIPQVTQILGDAAAPLIRSLCAEMDALADVRQRIERTLLDDPPALAREGGFTRDGFDAEIDELRAVSRSGRQIIADMETAERERTGVASLKVRFNRVFGYYIEISKSNLHLAPSDYERKQTIAGGERFSTPALRDYEAKILGADERILARELVVFEELTRAVAAEASRIQASARALATLDALTGLAETAVVRNYTKPHVHDGDELVAAEVRHPVVEARVAGGFVPNDVDLNGSTRHLVILTGPNMGGKSTYLRQTALLPVLAQMGSFVPARDAKLPVVDRIYARVGASDNIARGQSTFMVEMQETANILHTATSRSLVVLDEIGRGTATFDGLSIAWAVAEHLASHPTAQPKTLFATHYHELTDLADGLPGVVNAHVAAREWKDDIVFLRKILPGRADRSYGIQVARLAGLPPAVIARAKEILIGLERDELARGGRPTHSADADDRTQQLALFADAPADGSRRRHADSVLARLLALDLDGTSPRDALAVLAELQHLAGPDETPPS